jgi:hypothetical protein
VTGCSVGGATGGVTTTRSLRSHPSRVRRHPGSLLVVVEPEGNSATSHPTTAKAMMIQTAYRT